MSAPTAYVYIDTDGSPRQVGRLYVTAHRGRETATFQYDDAWIASDDSLLYAVGIVLGVRRYLADGRLDDATTLVETGVGHLLTTAPHLVQILEEILS